MKQYKVAIMGTGNIAKTMARTLAEMPEVICYAVGSRTIERAKTFAASYGFERAYGSYEELLCDDAVQLVYIATPHSEHSEGAKLCINHGKPALVEKAFAVNARQAKEVLQLAKKKHVLVAEAIWTRYLPFLNTIKEVLASGIIGRPTMLTANLGYDIDEIERLQNPDLAGGALLDVGVYPLNFACMLWGNQIATVSSACTYTKTDVDEQESITLIYPDGKMAVLNSSMLSLSDRKGIIHGDKGFMVIENINNYESLSVYNTGYQRVAFYERPPQITGYEYEVRACFHAMERGEIECPEMPHAETIFMMELMDDLRRQWEVSFTCE